METVKSIIEQLDQLLPFYKQHVKLLNKLYGLDVLEYYKYLTKLANLERRENV